MDNVLNDPALEFFGEDQLATDVWRKKYALKTKDGELLEKSPIETFKRLAEEFHRIEMMHPKPIPYVEIYHALRSLTILPGGSIYFGVGNNETISSLGNCFVIGYGSDSYTGILFDDLDMVSLMKRRGGVGLDLSHLRPGGSIVNNAAQTSTGAVSFAHRYSHTAREVAQDGRRGALMLTMDINHPDSLDFIFAKDDLKKITGANISVKVDDRFMHAVEDNSVHECEWEEDRYPAGPARDIFNKIVHQAWKSAEPGVLFWDTILRESPADIYRDFGFGTKSTNPCGEIPLSPYDSCRLLHINLYNCVDNPFTENAKINYSKVIYYSAMGQKLLDDIVTLEEEKIKKIIEKIKADKDEDPILVEAEVKVWEKILWTLVNGRRTGLGVTGVGDMFAALGLKYDSDEALFLYDYLQIIISTTSYEQSIEMARDRGAFPLWNFELEQNHPYLKRVINMLGADHHEMYANTGRRNIADLTIAPTGSTSLLAQVTSGLEPLFAPWHIRGRKVHDGEEYDRVDDLGDKWKDYKVFHHKFKLWYDTKYNHKYLPLESLNDEQLEDIFKQSPYYGSTASEIDYKKKIDLQSVAQKWIDHSISITHNVPAEITEEEVAELYMYAWKKGCKGITIYREGTRDAVLKTKASVEFKTHDAPKRGRELKADLHQVSIKGVKHAVVIGLMDGKPYEVFAFQTDENFKSKHGIIKKIRKRRYDFINGQTVIENIQDISDVTAQITTVLTSGMLRHGAKPQYIIHGIEKFNLDINHIVNAIKRVLKKYVPDGTDASDLCPECGQRLVFEGGCYVCKHCGHSKCG